MPLLEGLNCSADAHLKHSTLRSLEGFFCLVGWGVFFQFFFHRSFVVYGLSWDIQCHV